MSEQFKISLGIDLNTSNIQNQIRAINTSPVDVDVNLDIREAQNQINTLRQQIQGLNNVAINVGGAGNSGRGGRRGGNRATEEYRDLMSLMQRMSITAKKGIGLDTRKDAQQIIALESHLRNLENRYDNLMVANGRNLTPTQFNSIIRAAEKAAYEIGELEAKAADARNNLARGIQIKLTDNTFTNSVSNIETKFNRLTNKSNEVRLGINSVRQALSDMHTANAGGDIEGLISANERYERSLKDVENQLRINARRERENANVASLELRRQGLSADIDKWLKNNSAAASQFGAKLRDIQAQIKTCDATKLSRLRAEFNNVKKQADLAGKATQTLGDRLKAQFSRYSAYLSIASVFMYTTQALRDMFNQVVAIDTAMTELKKVTDETAATYDKFLTNAASRASEIGTTIDGLVTSTADFARLGYDFADATNLAEVANIYTVVGDEIDSVDTATQSLISTMKAFKDEAGTLSEGDFAMGIVDKMNEVSNNFAISSGGIGEALTRSASSLAAANNDLDQSIALITAANTVVQDPTVVGTALKTVSMRVRGAKTEMEELGLDTEGMVESTSKLRAELKALTGVDIMLDKDTFMSTYDMIGALAGKWEELTDIQQASVTELIAGKRQGNIIASLMTNWDIAEEALKTSQGSAGSATREHEKWLESLQAKLNQLKAAWQGLAQAFMGSDFLKGALDVIIKLVEGLTQLIDNVGTLPTLLAGFAAFKGFGNKGIFTFDKDNRSIQLFGGNLTKLSKVITNYNRAAGKGADVQARYANYVSGSIPSFAKYASSLKGANASMGGYIASLGKGAIASVGMNVATGLLQGGLIALASIAISAAIKGLDKLITTKKELAEQVDELTSKYEEQHNTLIKNKGDFDASNEESLVSQYAQLSKGVNNLGENVSLTAAEYEKYKSVTNEIANLVPSLVAGYDAEGNAILNTRSSVDELVKAYEKLIEVQNNKILKKAGNIEKDFKNDIADLNNSKELNTATKDALEEFYTKNYKKADITKYFDKYGKNQNPTTGASRQQIKKALNAAGYEIDAVTSEGVDKQIAKAIKENPEKVKAIIDDWNAEFEEQAKSMKTVAEAAISNAFDISDSKYAGMGDKLQGIARSVVSGFDADFYAQLIEEGGDVQEHINDMLDAFAKLETSGKSKELEAVFDMQTKFNSGDVSLGEFINSANEAYGIIDNLNVSDEIKNQIKLSLNAEDLVKEFNSLTERLTSDKYDIQLESEEAKEFLASLTNEEFAVFADIIPEIENNGVKESVADLQAMLNREMALRGLTLDLDINAETEGIEGVNNALAESVSATGLTANSISYLKSRYAELESQGYNLSQMFEETANGIHLNRRAVSELEQAYASQRLADVDKDLATMKNEYDLLGEEIKNCDDAAKKSDLFNQRMSLAKQISEASTLATQYKGLASAYNAWLKAEEAGSERDMYENVIKGFETMEDELSRGWIDDGTIKFLELLTGRTDLVTAKTSDLKKVYDSLDDTIKNTSYSVRDFFTVDDEGNSTNAGVYNFLDAVGQLEEEKFGGKDIVKRDKDGNIIEFDFGIAGGDEVIAEALGISEELVQIMVRAADDAGFVITMDGAYKQLADLQNEATAAADYLNEIGKTEFKFDFNTTDVANIENQLKEAKSILEDKDFWNADGTFNFDADGATQAMQIVSTLQAKLDSLTNEKYGIGLTVEDAEFQEPLEKLQKYGHTVAELNQYELNPKTNTENIKKLEGELEEIAKYFANLSEEKKIELGFEADDTWEDVQAKIESGEVKIPTVLDIQANMDKNLETLTDLALLESGFLSNEEEKAIKAKYDVEVDAGEVNTDNIQQDVKDQTEENLVYDNEVANSLWKGNAKNRKVAAFIEIFGAEDVDDLAKKLDGLTDEQIQVVADVIGQVKIEDLKTAIGQLDDKYVQAIAEAMGKGDIEGLKTAIKDIPDKKVAQAIAQAFGYKDVDGLCGAIDGMDSKTVQAIAKAFGATDVDGLRSAVNRLDDKNIGVAANVNGKGDVDNLRTSISDLEKKDGTKVTIKTVLQTIKETIFKTGSKRQVADGTAHADGTAFAGGTVKSGKAFKQGYWGIGGFGEALVGELGQELVVRDGKFFTVGDNGAEFFSYKPNDIIFNAGQTKQLFEQGRITNGKTRGRAVVSGTAFASGTAFSSGTGGGWGKVGGKAVEVKADTVNVTSKSTTTKDKSSKSSSKKSSSKKSTTKKSSSKKSSSSSDDFEETFDWIEIKISRLERGIDRVDKKASRTWEDWGYRNKGLSAEISEINTEISTLDKAYDKYIAKANSVGLASKWKKKVKNGTIDFSTITNEDLAEKIKLYQEYYEKALECEDKLLDAQDKRMSKYIELFDNVIAKYDAVIANIEHRKSMFDEFIAQQEESGHIVSKKYYEELIKQENQNIAKQKAERDELLKARDKWYAQAKANGVEDPTDTEDWAKMTNDINAATLAIEQGETALIEYNNAMRDIDWEVFDLIQERISNITDEADFFIDLMSSKDLYDDNGQLTNEGKATMGLHAQNYNTHMEQANKYGAEAKKLDDEIKKDPYNKDLIARRDDLLAKQRDSILAAQDEKEALRDLVEEGIEIELDALQERIDKYEESLDAAKDLYDYNKKVKQQTKEIANLEKQLAAYENDDSEEAKAKAQQLRVELAESREALEEMEYEKYISDQKELLDNLYTEYEEVLNTRLDNIDALLADIVTEVNDSSNQIAQTIEAAAKAAGYDISSEMDNIWNNEDEDKDVVSTYSSGTADSSTTTSETVEAVKQGVEEAVEASNTEANTNIAGENATNQQNTTYTEPAKPSKPSKPSKPTKPSKPSKPTETYPYGKASATSGNIGYGASGKAVKAIQYALNKLGYGNSGTKSVDGIFGSNTKKAVKNFQKKMGISQDGIVGKNTRAKFKKKGYASGAKSIEETMAAWTQEAGTEYIVRPSDGAILTPLAKGDSVLNAAASRNIWDMANNPADFIRGNLDLGISGVPNNINVQNSYTQNLENVVFNMPNVQNYNEMLSAMQRDKNFEKLLLSMTVDRVAGKSSLAKGKAIR